MVICELYLTQSDKKEQLQTARDKIQGEIDKNYQSLVRIQNAIKDLSGDRVREEIAKHAASLAGSKYKWGGREKGAIDCSGTVYYSYNKGGVELKDKNAQGYHDMMEAKVRDELKPADIITYTNSKQNGDITHVQVYIGTAIGAPSMGAI